MSDNTIVRVSPEFAGKPFSAVFTHPQTLGDEPLWRIKGSGVHGIIDGDDISVLWLTGVFKDNTWSVYDAEEDLLYLCKESHL